MGRFGPMLMIANEGRGPKITGGIGGICSLPYILTFRISLLTKKKPSAPLSEWNILRICSDFPVNSSPPFDPGPNDDTSILRLNASESVTISTIKRTYKSSSNIPFLVSQLIKRGSLVSPFEFSRSFSFLDIAADDRFWSTPRKGEVGSEGKFRVRALRRSLN